MRTEGKTQVPAADILFSSHVVATPCPPTGCATSTVTLYADGRFVVESTNPTTTAMHEKTAQRMTGIRAWLHDNRGWILDPAPTPPPQDVVASCVVTVDGARTPLRNASICDRITAFVHAP
jgi:hypothetical protein